VTKMKELYGAPIATGNIAPIAAYLANAYGSGAPIVSPAPAAAAPPSSGAQLYAANCSACHGATGAGSAGVFPPLADDPVVTASDPKMQITIVLRGVSGKVIGGKTYSSPMPPFAQLTDADIAAIIDHERTSWGNNAPLTTPAAVKQER
jgi:mono/diheme cytochrome c family protein